MFPTFSDSYLTFFFYSEKLERLRNQWSSNAPQWNSNINQMYDYNRLNMTDLKMTLNSHHAPTPNKIRNKDRPAIGFGYQPVRVPEDGDVAALANNANQKITKQ